MNKQNSAQNEGQKRKNNSARFDYFDIRQCAYEGNI